MTDLGKLVSWTWKRRFIPAEVARERPDCITLVQRLGIISAMKDWRRSVKHDTVLITGDGHCLAEDVKAFKVWNIPHDIYCVNRSLLFFEEPVQHWAAIDTEESMWFAEYTNQVVEAKGGVCRHTIGTIPFGFDVFWGIPKDVNPERDATIWAGNTGYFAVLTALHMGYKRIILAGMPLDRTPHWYEPEDAIGPNWIGATYTQWMDFKMKVPNADRVRSMSGYSAFILGKATAKCLI